MANKLIYSSSNPLQMFVPDLSQDSRYNSKDFIDFDFPDTILPFEQATSFCQPWQLNDTIQLQLLTNVGPVQFKIRDCRTNAVIDTLLFAQILESENEPGLFIYEVSVPLNLYEEGCYYVELNFGGGIFILRSGDLNFAELHEGTLLAEYQHFENREDLYFETGFFPSVRIPATNRFDKPSQKATVYEDQILNLSALRSVKYRLWNLVIGGSFGIPDYFADMIGGIIGNSDFRIDGKSFTVADGEEMEPNGLDLYPMRGWAVKLRERYTRGGRVYENDEPINAEMVVMINVDSKGFGNSNTGSQTAIIDVQ